MTQNEVTDGVKSQTETKRARKFFVRTTILFAILIVISVLTNIAPVGVRELNNVFFSLFIHEDNVSVENGNTNVQPERYGEYTEPVRVAIPVISVDGKVLNPTSTDLKVLDNALLSGAVRYPGSGDLESDKNIFMFGHSSALPVIHNQAFKMFSRVKELRPNDEIVLYSKSKKYTYLVKSVTLMTASDAYVNLNERGRKLIIATCNSFGTKQDRYVVVADFAGSSPLDNK